MKKHIIAAAVAAAVAVPAVAQVTVGGILDVNAHGSVKTTTTTGAGVEAFTKTSGTGQVGGWNTSVLNFSATEDLGGGLKATAFANMALNEAGVGPGARDRYLNLAGSFGSVRIGRFAPSIDSHGSYTGHSTTGAAGALNHVATGGTDVFGTAAIVGGNAFDRQSNTIQFTLPTVGGLTAVVGYADNKTSTQVTTGTTSSKMQYLSAEYKAGPLSIMAATGDRKRSTAAVAGTEGFLTNATAVTAANAFANASVVVSAAAGFTAGATGFTSGLAGATGTVVRISGSDPVADSSHKSSFDWLGARYDLGVAQVSVSYATRKDRTTTGAAVAGGTTFATPTELVVGDTKLTSVGLVVPMGAFTFRAMTYQGDDKRGVGAADDKKLSGYQLGAQYALSKRTFAYAATGVNEAENTAGALSTGNAVKRAGTIMGLSHRF